MEMGNLNDYSNNINNSSHESSAIIGVNNYAKSQAMASSIARNFIVELTPDDVPLSEYLNRSQQYAQDGYYKQFMREYISWLIPQTEQLPQKLKSRFLYYRDKAIEENPAGFGRTGGAIAWMMTGFEYFLAFLQNSHMINEEQMKIMIDNAWKVFTRLAAAQLDKSAEETPTKMFLEAVADLIETKKIHLQTVGGFPENNGGVHRLS